MRLSHKIEDIRVLTAILRKGWDNKTIFVRDSNHNKDFISSREANPGWEQIIMALDNYFIGGIASFGDEGPTPSGVYMLLVEAEAVLAFFPEENKPTVNVDELRSQIAKIVRDNSASYEAADDILDLLQKNKLL